MKKLMIMAAILLLSAGISYGAAFKSGNVTLADNNDDSLAVQLSTNVSLAYDAATGGLGYSVSSYHSSGTRTYASSSGDAAIFWQGATGVAPPAAPSGTASAAFDSNWDAL